MTMAPIRNSFLRDWANQDEEAQVALLSAPAMFPLTPSAALSIFKSALEQAGISSKVIYAMFPMLYLASETIPGLSKYLLSRGKAEYLFAHLTDVPASVSADQFVRTFAPSDASEEAIEEAKEILSQGTSMAEAIVEATARRIVHMGAEIVAASTSYTQQLASLAILRRVKELDPQVRTILGGYNVSGEMGLAILRNFPSVDYVSFGEGDEIIAEVCSTLLAGGNRPMPYGVVGRDEPCPQTAPFRMTKDMNGIAFPDHRDFFEEARKVKDGFYGKAPIRIKQAQERTILLEGSRGCWWGAKHACSFCSMNGLNNAYREKTPEKLHDEILRAEEVCPGAHIRLCDNVISSRMIRELAPLLVEDRKPHSLSASIRTDRKPEEIRALSEAGFHQLQSGVESLNDHLLACMNKGVSAVQNIALLKYCATFCVCPTYSLLSHIPGERREDYEQMMETMLLIPHLHPPRRVITVAYMRFSRYCDHPEDYGLDLQPDPLYQCCFPDRPDIANNIGVYYELVGGPFADTVRENQGLYKRLDEAVSEWNQRYFSDNAPALFMTKTEFGISIRDTRACAEEESCLLTGPVAEVYRLAWEPVSLAFLLEQLPESSEEEVQGILDDLVARKLMLFLSEKYLSLAVKNGSDFSLQYGHGANVKK